MAADAPQRCTLCDSLDIVDLITDLSAYQKRQRTHQPSYQDLVRSATAGCDLCTLLHGSLFRETVRKGSLERVDSGTNPFAFRRTGTDQSTTSNASGGVVEDVAAWHEQLDAERNPPAFVLEITAESTLSADFAVEYVVRYQRPFVQSHRSGSRSGSLVEAPRPRRLVLSNEHDLGLGIRNRPIAAFPSFGLYSSWLWECAYGPRHSQCQKARLVDLPMRLIDVGMGNGSAQPKLAITGGMQGQYLTLSHRWGKDRILTTTSKNLIRHIRGLPFNGFPKMFRDAILVTKMLGFRYLWIDSLCIVQDDVADWENECSRMGDIYLNSVCTLAAPSASSSEGDLLSARKTHDLQSCRLDARQHGETVGGVTLGLPPSDLKEKSAMLSSRAWVLQEQLLSPRTLYFSPNGMYFQCTSHECLESYHHALPPERVTPWRTAEAGDLPKTLMSMAFKDPIYWYAIVRQYSFRHLTYGDDKLNALSGLANIVSAEDGAERFGRYWAGLWEKDICRGLLWTSEEKPTSSSRAPLHDVDDLAPSWSWASQNTPVEWRVLHDWNPDLAIVSCKMQLTVPHPFGRVRSGRLELEGRVRSAILRRRRDLTTTSSNNHDRNNIYLTPLADSRELTELRLDDTFLGGSSAGVVWPDADPTLTCRCLMLGSAESSLYGKRWFALVLVEETTGEERLCRRIGVASSMTGEKVHARSVSAEASWAWMMEGAERGRVVVV